jgi:hypothetical protein
MVEELLDDTKLIKVQRALASQLKLVAVRLGTSVSEYASVALSQALRVDDMGSNLENAVDVFELVNVHKGAGLVNLPRNSVNQLMSSMDETELYEIHENFFEAGRWYAAYISSKFSSDHLLTFLQDDFKVFWNLDEVEIIERDVLVEFRATSFRLSSKLTDLLVMYTKGIFEEMGYTATVEEILPGLVFFRFLKTLD